MKSVAFCRRYFSSSSNVGDVHLIGCAVVYAGNLHSDFEGTVKE